MTSIESSAEKFAHGKPAHESVIIEPPPCPAWCTAQHSPIGWEDLGPATSKACLVDVPARQDRDGHAVSVVISRAADVDHDARRVGRRVARRALRCP